MSNGAELVNLPPISARNDTAPSTTADAVGEGAEPAVEPVVEPIVEIVVEPPVIEPVAEPAVEPVNEPVIDRPSKPFKLTRHRMYIILLTLGFGLSKAVFAYMGHSVIPTTLEFILGGVVAAGYLISNHLPVCLVSYPFIGDLTSGCIPSVYTKKFARNDSNAIFTTLLLGATQSLRHYYPLPVSRI
ncbi:hypothetical protein M408DRAFT_24159 [Serendipita vermifera MAFF 305830]|uniref:Uncharacterized protein n=1 Tax=Serendipita vermifera MAFF 305830 TaxID=933852 RepID=A0A0C3AT93_SERVB|nr:hypothetical protein M408DRAFT_24159 [Serendipita vermifera MAFF 305830]